MATFPWVYGAFTPYLGLSMHDFPELQRWVEAMQARPAVRTGMAILT